MTKGFQHLHTVTADRILTVDTSTDLPATAPEGSIRYVLDDDEFYWFDGISWSVLGGSAATAAYTTIQTDLGTFPIATTPTETLVLTSSDGSLDITGTVGTDTVDFKVSSSSPGYTFARFSDVIPGTWLLNQGVPSNIANNPVQISSPLIVEVNVDNEATNTFDLGIYERDDSTTSLLTTVSIVASKSATFSLSQVFTQGKRPAVQLTSGSARNVVVGLTLKGG